MGQCVTKNSAEDVNNRRINSQLKTFATSEMSAIKILLLGAGECGKSTILKQMKILHEGYKKEELMAKQLLIRQNTLQAIQTLCQAAPYFKQEIECNGKSAEEVQEIVKEVNEWELNDVETFTDDTLMSLRDMIALLWEGPALKQTAVLGSSFGVLDSAAYFLNNVHRTYTPGYVPEEADVLRSRVATVGVVQYQFHIEDNNFQMFDVGGQRGERKKWIHCFENVKAIMFITSLSEYDQTLAEDPSRNRMRESLTLFDGIVNLPWFEHTSIILFFNKVDIFREKIELVPLENTFPDFIEFSEQYKKEKEMEQEPANEEGTENFEYGQVFIKEMYFSRTDRRIYPMATTATNTENIEYVWKCVKHTILHANLATSGLLAV